jgi:hypothetical protein
MGWWTLGAEDDDSSMGSSAAPSVSAGRGVTGGRVSTGRMAARGRGPGRGAVKQADGTIRSSDSEEPSLFTAIGRMVNTLAGVDDESTIASAKYDSGKKKVVTKSNADEAQRRANEMANAMAWLSAGDEPSPAPGSGLFTGGDNWWEKDDASTGGDDISLFSANTDFKTQDMPDLMTMLHQKQEENLNAKLKGHPFGDDKSVASGPGYRAPVGPAKEAVERATRMGDALLWWQQNQVTHSGQVRLQNPAEMKKILAWWSANAGYVPPGAPGFDADKGRAMKVLKILRGEQNAKGLNDALHWWSLHGQDYAASISLSELEQGIFQRVNDLFGGWQLKGLPQPEWTKFSAVAQKAQAVKRAQDLQACLELVSSGRFETSHPHYMQAINRVKDLMVDYQLSQDKSALELEKVIKWWNSCASTFDPLTASESDLLQFRKCKGVLAKFGYREGDDWESPRSRIQAALKLWTKYKDVDIQKLDADTAAQLKMVQMALMQLKRDSLTPEAMHDLASALKSSIDWYLDVGQAITELANVDAGEAVKFRNAEGLLTLWGYKVDPTPEQLKEIADALIFFRRNGYDPKIFDKYDGEEGAKFQRLQQAMMDWRLSQAESCLLVGDEAEGVAKELEESLDWWVNEGEDFSLKNARPADVFSAEKIKHLVDNWNPSPLELTFTWKRSKKACAEIQEAINLWRDNGKTFDMGSIKLSPQEKASLSKLQEAFLGWRRQNASRLDKTEAEQTVKDMINAMNWWKKKGKNYDAVEERLESVPSIMRHQVASDTLEEWHRENGGFGKHSFEDLSAKDRKRIASDVVDSLNWWERNGKNLDVSKELEDEENFSKAQELAKIWQKATMSKDERQKACDDINGTIKWARGQSKDFHLETESDPRADELAKLFHVWGVSKSTKPKAAAKDIEESIDWWRRNNFSVDVTGKIPADAERVKKLDHMAQTWYDLRHPDQPMDGSNMGWFRSQMMEEIKDALVGLDKAPVTVTLGQGLAALSDEQKRAQEMASALGMFVIFRIFPSSASG